MNKYRSILEQAGLLKCSDEINEINEITPREEATKPDLSRIPRLSRPVCRDCGGPLLLDETRMIGRCLGCQDEAERVETIARMKVRRERFTAKVTARTEQLRIEGGTR